MDDKVLNSYNIFPLSFSTCTMNTMFKHFFGLTTNTFRCILDSASFLFVGVKTELPVRDRALKMHRKQVFTLNDSKYSNCIVGDKSVDLAQYGKNI